VFHVTIWVFDLLVNPLTWGVLLAAVGATTAKGRAAAAAGATLLLVASLEPFSNRLLWALERQVPDTERPGVTYDVAVILGGAVDHGPTQTGGAVALDDDADRVLTARALLAGGRARELLLTGGAVTVGDRVIDAAVVRDLLVSLGADPARLVTAEAARNTVEEARETRRIAAERGYRTILLVTSARHMPRALAAFRAAGLPVDARSTDRRSFDPAALPASLIPRAENLADTHDVIREVVGRYLVEILS